MKSSLNDIYNKIKLLKPLSVLRPVAHSPNKHIPMELTVDKRVTNHEILKELQELHTQYKHHKVENQPITPDLSLKRPALAATKPLTEDQFYKTKVSNLDFRESSTLFSPQFIKLTKEILGHLRYNDLTREEVIALHEKLQRLSTLEFEWKEYNRRAVSKETTHLLFSNEYSIFQAKFKAFCVPSKEEVKTKRAAQKFMCHKAGSFAKLMIDYLYEDMKFKVFSKFVNYTSEDFGRLIIESIDPHQLFNTLARISIKTAHEKLLHKVNQKTYYKEDVLSINRLDLTNEFRLAFALGIFYVILNYGEETYGIDEKVAEIISQDVQKRTYYNNLLLNLEAKDSKSYWLYLDVINNVVNMFTSSGFFKSSERNTTENNNGKPKTTIQLVLPEKLTVTALCPFKFPNISCPPRLNKNDIDGLIKPLINGKWDLTKSDCLVSALNISRAKPHKVNELFLMMCKRFFEDNGAAKKYQHNNNFLWEWLMESNINLKVIPDELIQLKENELAEQKEIYKPTNISLKLMSRIKAQVSKTYNVAILMNKNKLQSFGFTKLDLLEHSVLKELEAEIVSAKIDLKYLRSRLFLSKSLNTFPIYITDTLCIRLRKYLREHWLSRTAGEFKHLLENYSERRLTLRGFKNLLSAYYHASTVQLAEFHRFVEGNTFFKKTGMYLLTQYFKDNPLDFVSLKKPMYFLNLHLAILKAIECNYYTAVNVEVDQNASALVILSIILWSKKMAELTNTVGGSVQSLPYDVIRDETKIFLETSKYKWLMCKNDNTGEEENTNLNLDSFILENSDVINFLCESRNLHKYAIMCFCYNQTAKGRIEDFTGEWYKEYGYLPNYRQSKVLNRFAYCYPRFIEHIFPNT